MMEDWVECELGQCFDFTGGGTPSKGNANYWNGTIPWASIKDLKGTKLFKTKDHISQQGLENSSSKIANPNDIILATRISPGTPIITMIDVAINQDLKIARPKIQSYQKWLFWLFQTLKAEVLKLSSGTTVLGINLTNLNAIKFHLPPLPIQRAIVSKIESLFSSLDSGIADLQKAQAQLKIYRQAVLKKAFEGELIELELEHVINNIQAGKSFRCEERPPTLSEVGVLKVSAVTWGEFREEESKTVTDSSKIRPEYFVKNGDFLLSRANTIQLVGNAVIVDNIKKTLMLSDKTLRITFHENYSPKYILYFLRSRLGRKQIEQLSTGNQESMRNIGQKRIKQISTPFPKTFKSQLNTVKEIESRLSVCNKVEESIKESLERAQALRQSILKIAFEGKLLTSTEIEHCKLEKDYEPASVLLERIKSEKLNATAPVKKKKTAVKVGKAMSSTDVHAAIISKIIKAHASSDHKDKLGHVKCEKIVHFAEYHLGIAVDRKPVKDAAGPDDFPHLKKVESRAKKAGFFTVQEQSIGYAYIAGSQSDKIIDKLEKQIDKALLKKLDALIDLFLPFDKVTSEIPATLYAAWNNLIILGNSPSDKEIIYEARENWSASKLKIPRSRFVKGLAWLRKNDLIPNGTGLLVTKRKR